MGSKRLMACNVYQVFRSYHNIIRFSWHTHHHPHPSRLSPTLDRCPVGLDENSSPNEGYPLPPYSVSKRTGCERGPSSNCCYRAQLFHPRASLPLTFTPLFLRCFLSIGYPSNFVPILFSIEVRSTRKESL